MANTYYDSDLTGEQIEQALEAIDGVIVPANNGKVLAINNGKIEARSVQWGGGSAVLEPLSVTENGDYTPEAGVDGFDEVHVSVPNSYSASDEGKVVNNGALVTQTERTSQITQNGTYDTTLNNRVTVNVSGGSFDISQYNIAKNVLWENGSATSDRITYSQNKIASATRIRVVDSIPITLNHEYYVKINDGFDAVLGFYNSSDVCVGDNSLWGQYDNKAVNFPNTNTGRFVIIVRKSNDSAITPSEITDSGLAVYDITSLMNDWG